MDTFPDRLKTEKAFIPFNNAFDYSFLSKELQLWISTSDAGSKADIINLFTTCRFLPELQKVYKQFLLEISSCIKAINLPYETLCRILVACTNISYLTVSEQFKSSYQTGENLYFSDVFGHQTSSNDPGIGPVNTSSAMSTMIDVLHIAINNAKDKAPAILSKLPIQDHEILPRLDQFILICNAYFSIKNSYEAAIWNNGYFESTERHKYFVRFANIERLKLEEVGRMRLQQDSMSTYFKLAELLGGSTDFDFEWNKIKKEDIGIGSVKIRDGYIEYELTGESDPIEFNVELNHFAALQAFYPFLSNIEIPNCHPLKLWDILSLFHLVLHLFSKVSEGYKLKKNYDSIADILDSPFRIRKIQLVSYLQERTNYPFTVINQFIKLISNPEGKWINFWNYPLLVIEEDILAPFLTITSPMIFHLIDNWLTYGGYDLKERGTLLEKYVRERLDIALNNKGYTYNILQQKKIKINSGESEEIDLLIILKDIVIIADIKCIRYPMEIRDYHNNYERLRDGSCQVNRKTEFIKKHQKELIRIIGDIGDKPIVKLLITSYPIFAGCIFNDVPVVDFRWLEGYMNENALVHYSSRVYEGKYINQPIKNAVLYNNETDFCKNFEKQMRNPAIVEVFKSRIELHDIKMTVEGSPFEIYLQTPTF